MRSWLTYTAARLGLFAAAFGIVYLFGARSWIALVLAWLISGLASYVLLSKLRDRMSAATVERLDRRRSPGVGERLSSGAAREDGAEGETGAAPAEGGGEGQARASAGDA
ncbi:DUF4229 domain-containing protein [Nocardiopsis sp. FIRDI 009]|uniref:DUF4229 domain-containing protein n=1 Tax=Nocardiopsis sp. FIRDI 009 TaxID=714197 RepID=UPI000E27CE9F|nr:DUF4229 domain-containing protein [Nocardiopsis sp. FIRDI 009]